MIFQGSLSLPWDLKRPQDLWCLGRWRTALFLSLCLIKYRWLSGSSIFSNHEWFRDLLQSFLGYKTILSPFSSKGLLINELLFVSLGQTFPFFSSVVRIKLITQASDYSPYEILNNQDFRPLVRRYRFPDNCWAQNVKGPHCLSHSNLFCFNWSSITFGLGR